MKNTVQTIITEIEHFLGTFLQHNSWYAHFRICDRKLIHIHSSIQLEPTHTPIHRLQNIHCFTSSKLIVRQSRIDNPCPGDKERDVESLESDD